MEDRANGNGASALHADSMLAPKPGDRPTDLLLRERYDLVERVAADVECFLIDLSRQPVGQCRLVFDLDKPPSGNRLGHCGGVHALGAGDVHRWCDSPDEAPAASEESPTSNVDDEG